MNIENKLSFSPEKPAIVPIRKTDKFNLIAVGLEENQLLAEHQTPVPTLLTVLKGKIAFHIEGEIIDLEAMDLYNIPPKVLHEVRAYEKSVFTLLLEK